jgi:hypothetical protein
MPCAILPALAVNPRAVQRNSMIVVHVVHGKEYNGP